MTFQNTQLLPTATHQPDPSSDWFKHGFTDADMNFQKHGSDVLCLKEENSSNSFDEPFLHSALFDWQPEDVPQEPPRKVHVKGTMDSLQLGVPMFRERVNSLLDESGIGQHFFLHDSSVVQGLPQLVVPDNEFPLDQELFFEEETSTTAPATPEEDDIETDLEADVSAVPQQSDTPNQEQTNQGVMRKNNFRCPVKNCNKKFDSRTEVIKHAEYEHDGRSKRYLCRKCSKAFLNEKLRNSHEKTHTRVPRDYICCGKVFATKEGHRLHKRNHHGEGFKYHCQAKDCEFKCVRQQDLKVHIMRKHTNDKPYPCRHPGCTKSFAVKAELRRHLTKKHKTDKNFEGDYELSDEEKHQQQAARKRTESLLKKSTDAAPRSQRRS